jgi:hypothetical protein
MRGSFEETGTMGDADLRAGFVEDVDKQIGEHDNDEGELEQA